MNSQIKEDIKNIAEELSEEYEYVGIRIQDVPFELGALNHNSRVWVDGEETEEELNGACAISVTARGWERLVDMYYGDHIAIIVGDTAKYGEDAGEIIIEDAEVVRIIK